MKPTLSTAELVTLALTFVGLAALGVYGWLTLAVNP